MPVVLDSEGWYSANDSSISLEQAQHNARIIWWYCQRERCTLNACAGICGNIRYESYFNPWRWEHDEVPPDPTTASTGFGLTQWTPADEKIIAWCIQNNRPYYSGDSNMVYLLGTDIYLPDQWSQRISGMTWREFLHSTDTPENLAETFCRAFERPASPDYDARRRAGRTWYDYLASAGPLPPINPPPGGAVPIWLLWRMSRNNNLIGGGPIA